MSIILKVKLNCAGGAIVFPVPLFMNEKVITLCGDNKVNIKITNKGKSITFIAKASKNGSKKNGDRRIFWVPNVLNKEVKALCGTDTVKVTITKRVI